MSDWNTGIIEEFRGNAGVLGGPFEGKTLLLVTHRGARSGIERTQPLAYQRDGDRIFIFASKGGSPSHPHWYLNMMANPEVTVEIGVTSFTAHAVDVGGEERDRIYERQVAVWPQFGDYQRDNPRTIPVVELLRVG